MAEATVRAGQILTADTLNNIFLSFGKLLQKVVLDTDSATIVFPNIDQSFTNLRVVVVGAFADNTASPSYHWVTMRFNGDAGNSYNWFINQRQGNGTTEETYRDLAIAATVGSLGFGALQSTADVLIPGYTLPAFHNMHGVFSGDSSGTLAGRMFVGQAAAVHNSSVPVQEIELGGGSGFSYLAGTAATLYGLP